MKIYLKIVLILAGMSCAELQSASIKGGSISYSCLGNQTYKVTAKINRECSGDPINTFQMYVFNGLGKVQMTASRVSIQDVSGVCKKVGAPCQPNQQSAQGTEEHIYEVTVDFNSSTYKTFLQNRTNNCQVYFSFEADGRDTAFNTISKGQFFIMAMLNLCVTTDRQICNSSPLYHGRSTVNACCNFSFVYHPDLRDGDNDSMIFDTLVPHTGFATSEQYNAGYSAKYALSPYCPPNPGVKNCIALINSKPPRGIFFDPANGDLILTPTLCTEKSSLLFRAYEYRLVNGDKVMIGFSERELGIYINACADNIAPSFVGSNKYSVCEGGKLCFTISTKDEPFLPKQTTPDTVSLTWDSGIAGATLRIIDPAAREKSAEFCWQTKKGDANALPYTFSVSITDDFCKYPLETSKSYNITVKAKASDVRSYKKTSKGKLIMNALVSSDTLNYGLMNYTFQYTIRDSSNSGPALFMSFKRNDSFTFSLPGTYVVEHQINNPPVNCPSVYLDTIIITNEFLTSVSALEQRRLRIVPNPGNGVLQISSDEVDLSGMQLRVYSVEGKLLHQQVFEGSAIDVSGLPSGLYIIELHNAWQTIRERIVIE